MNRKQAVKELRKAIQLFLSTMDADTQAEDMLMVSSVFPAYETDRLYREKEVFKYGVNAVGDSQLYMVLQQHTSSSLWKPDETAALYKAIGINDDGIPFWVQPLENADSYKKDDKVIHKGVIWVSDIDLNVWEPGVYGWTKTA